MILECILQEVADEYRPASTATYELQYKLILRVLEDVAKKCDVDFSAEQMWLKYKENICY